MTPDELAARQEKFGLNNMTVGGGVGLEEIMRQQAKEETDQLKHNIHQCCLRKLIAKNTDAEIGPEFLGWHGEM
jgi:hypothetical protein